MTRTPDPYADFVNHPRYGRRPRLTGLNPDPMAPDVHLHWNATTHDEIVAQFEAVMGKKWPYGHPSHDSNPTRRIPNTAVAADLTRQTPATVAVTHYFDLERKCRDCERPFIFFAQEQKHWYEQLGFALESDCIRCVECRKRQQGIARQREVYESLFHVQNKTHQQTLEMADACLTLIEQGIFAANQTQRVRMLLNGIPEEAAARNQATYSDLVKRLIAVETKPTDPSKPP